MAFTAVYTETKHGGRRIKLWARPNCLCSTG